MNAEVFLMNNKIQAKDLINLGLFTVLYFVIGLSLIHISEPTRP